MKFEFFERFSGRVGSNRGRPDSGGRAAGGAARCGRSPTRARRHATAGGHPHTTLVRTLERVGALAYNADARRRALAFALAVVCVGMLVAPVAVASAGASTGEGVGAGGDERSPAPAGMVGVPADNVHAPGDAGPPADADIPTHAAAWNVHADRHAGTLEVEIDATADGELILRASDIENHDGRTIAVDARTLRDAVGHYPRAAHGEHSSGDEWIDPISYEDGYALIDVERFSTNEITFDGEVVLTGDPASDGTTFSYDIDDSDGVDDFSIDVTGVEATTAYSETGSPSSIDYMGEKPPNDATVSASGVSESMTSSRTNLGDKTYDDNFVEGSTVLTYTVYDDSSVNQREATFQVYADGNLVEEFSESVGDSDGEWSKTWDLEEMGLADPNQVSVEVSTTSSYVEHEFEVGTDGAVDATVDVGDSTLNFGDVSESETVSKSYSASSMSESISTTTASGGLEYDVEYDARADTADPAVTVNGHETSYTGSLAEGETVSLDTDTDWITDGENDVTVSTATSEGVETEAILEYRHPAAVDQTVDYESETWAERYNVSRTWDSATEDASVTIQFASDSVVEVRSVEYRVNGEEWKTANDIVLDGTRMEAGLGDVSENDVIDVRATGSKVAVSGGEISVLEPTVEGNSLDTKFEIVDHSDDFEIAVGGTSEGNWLHHLTDESWTGAEPTTVVVGADGSQVMRVPDASAGSNARATTMPLEVEPNSGEVEIDVLDSEDPRLDVAPSSSVSEVDYVWHDTVSGDRYILFSTTHDIARDSGYASSPVTLTGPGYEEVLTILTDSDDDGETAGSGGGSGAVGAATSVALANPLLVLAVGVALVSGFAYTASRTEIPMRSTVGVAALVALFGLEAIAPGSISSGVHSTIVMVGSELGEVAPAVVLIVVGVGAYVVVTAWRARRDEASTPDTQVSLRLGGDDD